MKTGSMSGITSHVLDTSRGKPAEGITIRLEIEGSEDQWETLKECVTDSDGRVADMADDSFDVGHYRVCFLVDDYFLRQQQQAFYRVVRIEFKVDDPKQHYHVPLLLNPFGYSTYRGS